MIFSMPLPQMLNTMIVTIATTATSQLVWQLATADDDSVRPIAITMGPVTTGGK